MRQSLDAKQTRALLRFGLGLVLLGFLFFQDGNHPPQHQARSQQPAAPKGQPAEPPRFALLVGVGKYKHLSAREQLDGCANDVAAMRRVLIERFRFKENNIKSLIDDQATAETIRQGFKDLIAQVKALPANGPVAQIVFHFSGHGSQVPDQMWPDPDYDEEDGLDETIVPYDAKQQGGDEDIRDDEINHFVHDICRDKKAKIMVVLDSCHSGSGARGTTKVRQLSGRDLVPTKQPKGAPPPVAHTLPPGCVFLGACRATEVEPEFQEGDKHHGLLTRFLVEVLSEEKTVSKLSYDLLAKAITNRYREHRVMQAPTPQLEGVRDSLHATVLGAGPDIDRRPYYEVETLSDSKVRLAAGKFHDITIGSLFELYADPAHIVFDGTPKADVPKTVAWLRIASVDGATSETEVVQWDDGEKKYVESQLPTPRIGKGFAVKRHHQREEPSLRLKVTRIQKDGTDGPSLGPNDPALPKVIADALGGAKKKDEIAWLKWTAVATDPCDLVLRIDADYAALFPSTGIAEVLARDKNSKSEVPLSLRGGWGPIDLRKPDATKKIQDFVRSITRATNLIGLAQSGANAGATKYHVKMELLKVKYKDKQVLESKPWQPDAKGSITMREDDGYRVRVTNLQQGGKPVFVTVLRISPNMEIEVILPDDQGGEPIKLEAGDHTDSQVWICDDTDFGNLHTVVLVTREPVNFSFVQQAALPTTRSAPKAGGGGALDQLLQEQTYFTAPSTRGRPLRPSTTDTTWHSQVLSWSVVPISAKNLVAKEKEEK
jgi:hypothetical protein